jgi:transketolase
MRVLPNMLIAAPGDPMEVRACMRYLMAHPQPSYLRLGKAGEPCLHDVVPVVEPGKWLRLYAGDNARTLLATGAPLALAQQWITQSEAYRGYALHSLPLWGMATKMHQAAKLKRWSEVVTVEDHLQDAGFGSWMLEAAVGSPDVRINIRALSSAVCGMVGRQEVLNAAGGLGAA